MPPTTSAGTKATPIHHTKGAGHRPRFGSVSRPISKVNDEMTRATPATSPTRSPTSAARPARPARLTRQRAPEERHTAATRWHRGACKAQETDTKEHRGALEEQWRLLTADQDHHAFHDPRQPTQESRHPAEPGQARGPGLLCGRSVRHVSKDLIPDGHVTCRVHWATRC